MDSTVSAPSVSIPRVSVIVPVYNGIRTIRSCLESITALRADFPDIEIIVADNGSTDGTPDVIQEFPGVCMVEEREIQCASAARNAGARAATGEILAFTDADCVVTPGWLRETVPLFEEKNVVGVGGAIEGVPPTNEIQTWMNSRKILDQGPALDHPFMPYLQTANALFLRKAVVAVDGFDVDIPYGEDCDISWRIQEATGGELRYAPGGLVYHDHRCSVRGLLRQSMKNAMAPVYLARKWKGKLPRKNWKVSVWEVRDLLRHTFRMVGLYLRMAPRRRRFQARLDFLHRYGRKVGQIKAAWLTGQWNRW